MAAPVVKVFSAEVRNSERVYVTGSVNGFAVSADGPLWQILQYRPPGQTTERQMTPAEARVYVERLLVDAALAAVRPAPPVTIPLDPTP